MKLKRQQRIIDTLEKHRKIMTHFKLAMEDYCDDGMVKDLVKQIKDIEHDIEFLKNHRNLLEG